MADAKPRQPRAVELSSQCLEAFSEVGISMGYNNTGSHKERAMPSGMVMSEMTIARCCAGWPIQRQDKLQRAAEVSTLSCPHLTPHHQ